MTKQIENLLDAYADMQAKSDLIALRYQEQVDALLTPEQRARIAELKSKSAAQYADVNEALAALHDAIRRETIARGASYKGTLFQAVYSKPRITWDSKFLEGYAAAHPEIEHARKVGAPSVSIRAVQ